MNRHYFIRILKSHSINVNTYFKFIKVHESKLKFVIEHYVKLAFGCTFMEYITEILDRNKYSRTWKHKYNARTIF